MSVGLNLPKQVFAHGWWTFDNEKISKSRGKVINIDELISIAGVDSARYFLLRATPFGDDGEAHPRQRDVMEMINDCLYEVSQILVQLGQPSWHGHFSMVVSVAAHISVIMS